MATGFHNRLGKGQTSIRTEGSAKCPIHRNKEFVFVCSDCNELICTTCCVSGHRNHKLEEITDINSRQRDKLREFVNDTEENKLPELQKELNSIEEKVAETERDLGEVLPGRMQQHEEMCRTYIDHYINQLKSSCQEKKSENIEVLLIYKNEIQKRYEHLLLMTKECKKVLQSGSYVLVFDKLKDVECLKSEPLSMPFLLTPEYKPGTGISQHMEKAIGSLETCTPKCKPKTVNSEQMKQALGTICSCLGTVTRTWKKLGSLPNECAIWSLVFLFACILLATRSAIELAVGRNCIKMSTLVPKPDGSVFFHDKNSDTTLLLHVDGFREILQHDFNILDISLSPKMGTLWVISENSTIIEIDPPSSAQYKWLNFGSFCLHVTKNDNLVLGGLSLEIYTKKGTIRHSANDTSPMMLSVRISECPITGNIAVVRVHVLKPWMSDIAVYDKTLTVLFYYEMPGAGWNPVVSIAYDSFGNIVIGDNRSQTVYMISGTGQYIKHLFDIKGELRSIAVQTPCNVLWAAVQQDIPINRTRVKIKRRLLDLSNPSSECKQLRQNVLKTVYNATKYRERKCDLAQDVILLIKSVAQDIILIIKSLLYSFIYG